MSGFVDRKSTNLNKKKLKVVEVVRDTTTDEISELYVEESRYDSVGLTSVGTALTADNMNTIIKKMIVEELKVSDYDRVDKDTGKLSLDEEVTENFPLKTKGDYGSDISWEVVEGGSCILISNGLAIVIRKQNDVTVKLKATITFRGEIKSKTFNITILGTSKSDLDVANEIAESLELNEKYRENFELVTESSGANITWSVVSGTAIGINGNAATITRGATDSEVTLQAKVTYNTAVVTKNFNVIVPKEVEYIPQTFITLWTQEYNNKRSEIFEIESVDGKALFVDVANPDSTSLNVTVTQNNNSVVKIRVSETDVLNMLWGDTSVTLEFSVIVYSDATKKEKLGTLTGRVIYYFSSSSPND